MEKILYSLEEIIGQMEKRQLLTEARMQDADRTTLVRYLSCNSKDVDYNTLFICKGSHFRREYLEEALAAGAFAYVSEQPYEDLPCPAVCLLVPDVRKAMVFLADLFYNSPWKQLTTAGITGTKGKSTTAYFIRYILDDFLKSQKKPPAGILSSIENFDGTVREESRLTTPEPVELQRHLYNAVQNGMEYMVMEVSSQALKYGRVDGILYDVGCFLNIGEDHISEIEHSSFEDYLTSKLRLLKQCRIACVNLDSEYPKRILEAAGSCKKVITFGFAEAADIQGYDVVNSGKDVTFKVRCDSFNQKFKISIPGIFNVSNALGAIAVCYGLNIPLDSIVRGLKKARVSGRMEVFREKEKNLHIIVDYAHNKMSFCSLFESTRAQFPQSEISIVFGCPGKKAQSRRRELGEIAGKYAHKAYITEEDPGEEPVMQICEEIVRNMEGGTCECAIIEDRAEAIREAIREAAPDGVILLTGKGRETRQKRGTKYIETKSDVEIVKEILRSRG